MKQAWPTLAPLILLPLLLPAGMAQQERVFDENTEFLPPGCSAIAGDQNLVVHGGRRPARDFPGKVYSFDQRNFDSPACTRLTVTFVNEDDIRHQWMVHNVYPNGTFLIEVDGRGQGTGTFILPAEKRTVLFHCGVPQHQQLGMKGQILVDGGIGDLPNIPGITGVPVEGSAPFEPQPWWIIALTVGSIVAGGLLVGGLLWRRVAHRFRQE